MFLFYNPIYFPPNRYLKTPYLPLSYENSLPLADPSNHTFRGGTLCTGIKKIIVIINLTKMIEVSGLFPHIFGINTFSLFAWLSIELRSSRLCIKHFYQVSHHLSPWLYRK